MSQPRSTRRSACGRLLPDAVDRDRPGEPFEASCQQPLVWRKALQPAPHTRAVAAIDIAELALKIRFLAGDYTVAADKSERNQRHQHPQPIQPHAPTPKPPPHPPTDPLP